jgi:inhibitor of cysteine peptidase
MPTWNIKLRNGIGEVIIVKARLLVAVAVLMSSAVSGCTDGPGSRGASKTIQVSMDEVLKQSVIGQDVTLAVGDTLKVTLGSNHTTPYHWTADAKIGDSSVLKQTGHDYVRPNSGLMGAAGTEVWMFTALKDGMTTIVTDYLSIVGSDPMPVCTFTARVTVR